MTPEEQRYWQVYEAGLKAAIKLHGPVKGRQLVEQAAQAVEAQVQQQQSAQYQARAEGELLAFARHLTPQHLATIEQIHATQGWPGVMAALAQYLSPAAIEVATSTMVEARGDLGGLSQRIAQRIEAEDAATQAQAEHQAAVEKTIAAATPAEGDSPEQRAVKEGILARFLRDPANHAAAEQWLAPRRAQLEAAGLLARGEPAARFMLRTALFDDGAEVHDGPAALMNANRKIFEPKVEEREAHERLAAVVGEKAPAVRRWVDTVLASHTQDQLRHRLAKRDAEARQHHVPTSPLTEREKARIDSEATTRKHLSAAYDALEKRDEAAAEARRPATAEPAPEPSRVEAEPPSARDVLSQAYDRIASQGDEADAA
jgi:hypothetical protein